MAALAGCCLPARRPADAGRLPEATLTVCTYFVPILYLFCTYLAAHLQMLVVFRGLDVGAFLLDSAGVASFTSRYGSEVAAVQALAELGITADKVRRLP